MNKIFTGDNDRFAPIKIGDWVRFYRGGNLLIGVVEYFSQHEIGMRKVDRIYTNIGSIDFDSIIEVRHKNN